MVAKKIKRKIVSIDALPNLKVGLFVSSEQTIYVSQAILKLCESDMNLMRKSLKVLRMPTSNGKEKFDSVQSWIADLVSNGTDIFKD